MWKGIEMNTRELLQMALDALENSIDDVRNEYETNWRHGIPTREAQLDAMRKDLVKHEGAITAIRAHLAKPEPEPSFWVKEDCQILTAIRNDRKHADGYYDFNIPLYTKEQL